MKEEVSIGGKSAFQKYQEDSDSHSIAYTSFKDPEQPAMISDVIHVKVRQEKVIKSKRLRHKLKELSAVH